LGLTNLTYQILKICNQNEKESIQKLKESTNNPLLLLKDRTIENGTSSELTLLLMMMKIYTMTDQEENQYRALE